MRTATFETSGSISYPDAISFCFNLMLCKVVTSNDVTCRISCEGMEFVDKRTPYNNKVEMDLAMYARTFFSTDDGMMTIKTISVDVSTQSDSFYFTTNVVWGAMNGGEIFNASREITWFKNLPFTISMYIAPGSTITASSDGSVGVEKQLGTGIQHIDPSTLFNPMKYGVIRSVGGEFSTFSYQFDGTFIQVGDGSVTNKLVVDESDCGIYLRWIDRHGFYQYYLFTEGEKSEQSKNVGDKVSQLWYDGNIYYKSISRYQQKQITPSSKLCALWVNDTDFQLLKSICSSPMVDVYVGDNVWVPVTVKDTETLEKEQTLRDFEIEIVYPDLLTQKL